MPTALDIPAAETIIIASTNAFREKHNLSALKPNPQLAAAARAYAKALTARKELSHTANGTTPAERARKAGYQYCQIAENLAVLYDSRGFTAPEYAKRTLKGWKDSPGHRRNLLMPYLSEIGVAVARAPDNNNTRYVAVQLFGRPHSEQYRFDVANTTKKSIGYEFGDETGVVEPRYVVTLGACFPGTISFETGSARGAHARYKVRAGQVYTLKADGHGRVRVEVGGRARPK